MRKLAIAALLGGCTVADRYEDGALVERSLSVGVVQSAPCTSVGERRKSTTLGLSMDGSQTVLGYSTLDRICLPLETCGTLFFVESKDQVAAISRVMPGLPDACILRSTPTQ
ncbi:MAG: hypothetical protein AAGH68_10065 [Pseudomonadota bacterium]